MRIALSSTHNRPSTELPERNVMMAVLLHAVRDYESDRPVDRKIVRSWVEKKSGTFNLCAWAWDMRPEQAQAILLTKFDELDKERQHGNV